MELKCFPTGEDDSTPIQFILKYDIFSIFYVFYEQYLTIWADTLQAIGLSLLVVAVGSFIFSGFNFFSTCIITLTVYLTVLHMACLMYLWNITLNAISLVNLVMVN